MATQRQIEANRNNARKSTGPRSEEGKARSSRNAVKHGLTSRRMVLADEDEGEFLEFRIGIFEDLRPLGQLETLLANRLAAQMWRLARIPVIEAQLIDGLRVDASGGEGSLGAAWEKDGSPYGGNLGRLSRYEVALERSLTRLLGEFRRLQAARRQRDEETLEELEDSASRYLPGGWDSLERGTGRAGAPAGDNGAGNERKAGLRNEPNLPGESANPQAATRGADRERYRSPRPCEDGKRT